MSRVRTVTTLSLSFAVGVLLAAPFGAAEEAECVPGLVKERPAEGPFVETDKGFMVPYTEKIPGTDAEFTMVPVPGGVFLMGSSEDEEDRGDGEGPQIKVQVDPFWMGKTEVTWAEYKVYMRLVDIFIDFKSYKLRLVDEDDETGAASVVSAASNLYDPSMTFANGEDPQQPAVTMTPFGARQYTKFLSLLTGEYYRLPFEAEWEHAARAGSKTAFHFGDDPEGLDDYAWHLDNSDETTQKVGQKKPNPFGLYDMHGNVSELVIDQYDEKWYEKLAEKAGDQPIPLTDAICWPTKYDGRVFRGGSYDDFPEDCRSAKRFVTEGDDWKVEDPNEPKSPWWYADEPSWLIGFRLVRPLNEPTAEMKVKTWEAANDWIADAAKHRISEGRGAFGLVDPKLPDAIKELEEKKKQ